MSHLLFILLLSVYHLEDVSAHRKLFGKSLPSFRISSSDPILSKIFESRSANSCSEECSVRFPSYSKILPNNFMRSECVRCIDMSQAGIIDTGKGVFAGLPNLNYFNFAGNPSPLESLLHFGHRSLKILNLENCGGFRTTGIIKGQYPRLEKLLMSGTPCTNLTVEYGLPSLTHLDLSNTGLANDDFGWLPQSLQFLNLQKTRLPSLSLEGLERLQWLALSAIDIPVQAIVMTDLPNLTHLFLSSCGLDNLEKVTMSGLQNLAHVDLSENLFTHFTLDRLSDFSKLVSLNLAGNKQLIQITPSLKVTLQELDFSGAPVESLDWLPQGLSKLVLKSDPFNIFKIKDYCLTSRCEYLTHLELTDNQIQTLDHSVLGAMHGLRILLLNNNFIYRIAPGTFDGLTELMYLDFASNRLTELSSIRNSKKLETLLLDFNRFQLLNDFMFSSFPSLRKLALSDNNMYSIEPRTFDGLSALNLLSLSNNMLSYLPEDWTEPLTSLISLDVSGNLFKTLGSMKLSPRSSLQELYMSPCGRIREFDNFAIKNLPANVSIFFDDQYYE